MIQVIGAGMARTGTMSLKYALENLGYNQCFHMVELLKNPDRLKYIKELEKKGKTDFEALFKGFQATVDNPMSLYYRELLEQYPDAKVILTIREENAWYDSVFNTLYRVTPKGPKDIFRMIKGTIFSKDMRRLAPVFMNNDKILWNGFFKGKFDDKTAAIKAYHKHNEAVQKFVPSDQLLVMQIQEGWQPICDFLGKEVPNQPFPNKNKQAQLNEKIDKLVVGGVFEPY